MRANNSLLPPPQTDTQEFEDESSEGIGLFRVFNKNWFQPAAASMAKLKHVETTMYNLGLTSAGSLKPPQSIRKKAYYSSCLKKRSSDYIQQNMKDSNTTGISVLGTYDQIPHLNDGHHKSLQSTPSFHRWRSSASLSELTARQRKLKQTDPSSVKVANRPRSSSASRVRQLSASDSSSLGEPSSILTEHMEVKGERKSFGQKTYIHQPLLSSLGYRVDTSGVPYQEEDAAALESSSGLIKTHATGSQSRYGVQVPCSSPVSSDDENKQEVTEQGQEPIHLSLPSADVNSDDHEEETSDPRRMPSHTDELVPEDTREDGSGFRIIKVPGPETSEPTEAYYSDRFIQAAVFERQSVKAISDKSDFSGPDYKKCQTKNKHCLTKSSINSASPNGSVSSENSDLDENSFDRHALGDHDEKQLEKAKFIKSLHIAKVEEAGNRQPLERSATDGSSNLQMFHQVLCGHRAKPNTSLRGNVRIREDKNVTIDITPRNKEKNLMKMLMHFDVMKFDDVHSKSDNSLETVNGTRLTGGEADKINRSLTPKAKNDIKSLSNAGHGRSSIPVVTVNFEGDESSQDEMTTDFNNKTKTDVKASTYDFSGLDIDSNSKNLYKSKGERNYYEISRQVPWHPKSAWGTLRKPIVLHQENNDGLHVPVLLKTTKTAEFSSHKPKETVSKSAIAVQNVKKTVKNDINLPTFLAQKPYTLRKGQQACPHNGKMTESHKSKEKFLTVVQTAAKGARPQLTRDHSKEKLTRKPSSAPRMRSQSFSGKVNPTSVNSTSQQRQDVLSLKKVDNSKSKAVLANKTKHIPTNVKPCIVRSASLVGRPQASDSRLEKLESESDTSEDEEAQALQKKMAALGVEVGVRALEKAIYSSSRKSEHSQETGYLPSDPSFGLIPHYKHWLPEEYNKLKIIKRRLAEDDLLRQRQKLRITRQMKTLQKCDFKIRRSDGSDSRRHSYG